ncbi:MAG: tetratricopeptide repeat protein [Myxococcota bacterium]
MDPSARRATLTPILLALALGVIPGCVDHEQKAREQLESEGYSNVELEPKEGPGNSFTVRADKDGATCDGTVTVTAMPGSSAATVSTDVACESPDNEQPQEAEEAEEVDPLAEPRAACEEEPQACVELGVKLVEGPPATRDAEEARKVHGRACEAGILEACAHLGLLHLRGLGGEQSEEEAEALFTKACDGGNMLGCARLGRLRYINRQGREARKLLRKACEGGSVVGCAGLGMVLREGIGGKQDLEEAKRLFQDACDAGDMGACGNLGVMYTKGEGGVQSDERAREALKKACDGGVTAACSNLRKLDR